eukprot:g83316.t1
MKFKGDKVLVTLSRVASRICLQIEDQEMQIEDQEMQERLKMAEKEIQSLQQKQRRKEEKMLQKQAMFIELTKDLKQKLQHCGGKLTQAESDLAKERQAKQTLQKQLQTMQGEVAAVKEELRKTLLEKEEKLSSAQLQGKLEALFQENQELQQQLANKTAQHLRTGHDLEQEQQAKQTLLKELDTMRAELMAATRSDMQTISQEAGPEKAKEQWRRGLPEAGKKRVKNASDEQGGRGLEVQLQTKGGGESCKEQSCRRQLQEKEQELFETNIKLFEANLNLEHERSAKLTLQTQLQAKMEVSEVRELKQKLLEKDSQLIESESFLEKERKAKQTLQTQLVTKLQEWGDKLVQSESELEKEKQAKEALRVQLQTKEGEMAKVKEELQQKLQEKEEKLLQTERQASHALDKQLSTMQGVLTKAKHQLNQKLAEKEEELVRTERDLEKEKLAKHELQTQLQRRQRELTKMKESHARKCEQMRTTLLQEIDSSVRVKREKLGNAEAQQREQALAHKQQLKAAQQEMQSTQQEIQTLRHGLDAKEAKVEELITRLICCVCEEVEISRVFLPCGHCFCHNHPWQVGQECPKCRRELDKLSLKALKLLGYGSGAPSTLSLKVFKRMIYFLFDLNFNLFALSIFTN